MVKVICQHSGIEFEAASKRSKNHPLVSEAKAQAYKDGNFREFGMAMDAVQVAGGYETAEEFLSNVMRVVESVSNNLPEKFYRDEAEKLAAELANDDNDDDDPEPSVIAEYNELVDEMQQIADEVMRSADDDSQMVATPVEYREFVTLPDTVTVTQRQALYRAMTGGLKRSETPYKKLRARALDLGPEVNDARNAQYRDRHAELRQWISDRQMFVAQRSAKLLESARRQYYADPDGVYERAWAGGIRTQGTKLYTYLRVKNGTVIETWVAAPMGNSTGYADSWLNASLAEIRAAGFRKCQYIVEMPEFERLAVAEFERENPRPANPVASFRAPTRKIIAW